ncbi:MAG: TIGR04255 family protein [Pseudomonadota bacterium]
MEVGLTVQFPALQGLHIGHYGVLWERVRDEFPKLQTAPLIEPQYERFGLKRPLFQGFRVEMMSLPPMPRCWYLSEDETHLIQLQNDRISFNWRKLPAQQPYRQYEPIRADFLRHFRTIATALDGLGVPITPADQCEVTYVNQIEPCSVWENHNQADRIFSVLQPPPSRDPLPPLEETRFEQKYLLSGSDGQLIGRLTAQCQPGFRIGNEQPIFLFSLTARACRWATAWKG